MGVVVAVAVVVVIVVDVWACPAVRAAEWKDKVLNDFPTLLAPALRLESAFAFF